MSKEISVISTFATDRLIDGKTKETINEQKGGPILYLTQALEGLGLTPKLFYGEELLVEILVMEHDEFGSIKDQPKRLTLPDIVTPSAIVSTLLDEWDLTNAKQYPGHLFVDIQGYVRDGSDFGKKKAWNELSTLAPYIFCLKGNDIEVTHIPEDVVSAQKRERMLIITKDKRGVEVYHQGQAYNFQPKTIVRPKHTIGAGDTFFANFVYHFMETENIPETTTFALERTTRFLEKIK